MGLDAKSQRGLPDMETLEEQVLRAKTEEAAFNALAESQQSWMLRTASEVTHRYITTSDDEWSIALIAFHEAVQSYEADKGAFRPLAATVIRRRVIDFLRSEGKYRDELSVTPAAFEGNLEEEEAAGLNLQVQQRMAEEAADAPTVDAPSLARAEISEMQDILKGYGFSFFDLADCAPKSEKTRRGCAAAVKTMLATLALLALMRLKKLLPIRELSEKSGVVKKLLERHRRYIIAATEILDGDFPILAEYLHYIRAYKTAEVEAGT